MNSKQHDLPSPEPPDPAARRMRCDEIQALLFDYMTHELGDGRSLLIREHLRKCEECQAVAAEIQIALDMLHEASLDDPQTPMHLSDDRRTHIAWAFTHPVMDWIARHHVLVSIVVAILALVVAFTYLKGIRIWADDPWECMRVTVGIRHTEEGEGFDPLPVPQVPPQD